MYSTPSAFSDYQNQLDGLARMIVELTDGTTTWYLSDSAMVLTDGAVHDLLVNVSGISEKIDLPFSRKWAVGSVNLTLSNRPYQRVDGEGTFERLADQIGDIKFNTAKIYLMAGARATALSDCVTRFVGTVIDAPHYDSDKIQIRLADKGWMRNPILPQRKVIDVFTSAPSPYDVSKIPLAYGKYTIGGNDSETFDRTGNGLAVGVPVKTYNNKGGDDPRSVFADHAINAISEMWLPDDSYPHPHLYVKPRIWADDQVAYTELISSSLYSWNNAGGADALDSFDNEGDVLDLGSTATGQYCSTGLTFTANKTYQVLYTKTGATGSFQFQTSTGEIIGTAVNGDSASLFFTCNADANGLRIVSTTAVSTATFGNFSVREVTDFELITTLADRDFSSSSGNWTKETMNVLAIAGGDLNIAASAEDQYCQLTGFTALVVGQTYRLRYDYTENTAGFEFATSGGQTIGTCVAGTTKTIDFYCTAAASQLYIKATTASADGEFDNISIMLSSHSGLATGTGLACYYYFPASNDDDTGYVTENYVRMHNPARAWDHKDTTSADIYNNNDDSGVGCFGMDYDSNIWDLIEQKRLNNNRYFYAQGVVDEYYSDDTKVCGCSGASSDPSGWSSVTITGSWQILGSMGLSLTPPTTSLPLMIALKGIRTGASGYQPDTYCLLHVYEMRFRTSVNPALHESSFATLEGRKYGKWQDGRSSNYSYGDCIEDPVGIIESILREELDVANTDINLTSFIEAENTSVKARINLHSDNEMTAAEAIRQLAEQSTFAFFWSGSSQPTLIPLNDKTPTTERTIPWSRIVDYSLRVKKTPKVINHLTFDSRYLQEYGVYADVDTVEDSTSQTAFEVGTFDGKFKYKAQWPNIAGTSADHIAAFLVNSTDGLWSKKHNEIELQTKLFTNADLEIGDWIELDSTSVDPHIKCFGESWSGKQFLITSLIQTMAGTKIKAIELW